MPMPTYIAIYKTANETYLIEYCPLWDERPAGGIEIVAVTSSSKPQGLEELRAVSRSAQQLSFDNI